MARKDRTNQNPFNNPLLPPLIKGGKGPSLLFDVNITMKKVNEKNPLEVLIKRPVPLVPGTGLLYPLSHSINRLFPITIVGETVLDIDFIKLLKRPERLFILFINLFQGVSHNLGPF
jgi:hypothetical protein